MDSKTISSPSSAAKPRLLDQVRQAIRTRQYSYMTERAYVGWMPHAASFLRHTSTGRRIRHQDRSGALGAQGCQYHDDL